MQFFDIDAIQDYYESLATRNTDVANGPDNRSFARYNSESEMNDLKKKAGKNIVVVVNTGGHRVGHKDDRMLQREIVLRFAVYAPKNTEAAKQAAIKLAEEIMFDWMAEMEKRQEQDLDQEVECGVMHFLRPENFSWEEIEDQPWLQNHYGWDLTVPFRVHMQRHNAAKWGE